MRTVLDDPLVVGLGEHVALGDDMPDLVAFDEVRLVELLHRVELVIGAETVRDGRGPLRSRARRGTTRAACARGAPSPNAPTAEHFERLEVGRAQLAPLQAQVHTLLREQQLSELRDERLREAQRGILVLELLSPPETLLTRPEERLHVLLHVELEDLRRVVLPLEQLHVGGHREHAALVVAGAAAALANGGHVAADQRVRVVLVHVDWPRGLLQVLVRRRRLRWIGHRHWHKLTVDLHVENGFCAAASDGARH